MPLASVNGVDLHFEVVGDGFPIVFSHELAGDSRSWAPQVEFFSELYRCVTYNHRGYPPSSVPEAPSAYTNDILAEDLRGLLDLLGIERAHLVGHSMGGNVVLEFAMRYPDRCGGVVVAGSGSGTTHRERFEQDIRESIDLLKTRGMAAWAEVYSLGAGRLPFQRKDPEGWERFRARLAEHSALGTALVLEGVQLGRPTIFQWRERLNRLAAAVLVVIGDEDEPCVDPSVFMKREIPTSGLLVVPQSGHTINLEEPGLFNGAVLDFLRMVEFGRWATRTLVTTSLLPREA